MPGTQANAGGVCRLAAQQSWRCWRHLLSARRLLGGLRALPCTVRCSDSAVLRLMCREFWPCTACQSLSNVWQALHACSAALAPVSRQAHSLCPLLLCETVTTSSSAVGWPRSLSGSSDCMHAAGCPQPTAKGSCWQPHNSHASALFAVQGSCWQLWLLERTIWTITCATSPPQPSSRGSQLVAAALAGQLLALRSCTTASPEGAH